MASAASQAEQAEVHTVESLLAKINKLEEEMMKMRVKLGCAEEALERVVRCDVSRDATRYFAFRDQVDKTPVERNARGVMWLHMEGSK